MGNLSSRFNRSGAAPATTAPKTGGSRYAGIEPTGGSGPPDPNPGEYLLTITKASYERSKRTQAEFYEAIFEVVECEGQQASPPGSVVRFGQDVNIVGVKIIRDFIMAANGYDDLGEFNAYAARTPDSELEAVEGKQVLALVALGKPNGKGGNYTEWQFASVGGE